MAQDITNSVLFMGSMREGLKNTITESSLQSNDKSSLVEFIVNEASDYEVLSMALEGIIPAKKYDVFGEMFLIDQLKESVLSNFKGISKHISESTLKSFIKTVDTITPFGLSTSKNIMEFNQGITLNEGEFWKRLAKTTLYEQSLSGGNDAVSDTSVKGLYAATKGKIAEYTDKLLVLKDRMAKYVGDKSSSAWKAIKSQYDALAQKIAALKAKAVAYKAKIAADIKAAGGFKAYAGQKGSAAYSATKTSVTNAVSSAKASAVSGKNAVLKGLEIVGNKSGAGKVGMKAMGKLGGANAAKYAAGSKLGVVTPGVAAASGGVVIIGGAALAGLALYGAVKGYKRFLSQAAKRCNSLSGQAKTACMNKIRVAAYQNEIKDLTSAKTYCKKSKDPQKCQKIIDVKIQKLKEKISKLK